MADSFRRETVVERPVHERRRGNPLLWILLALAALLAVAFATGLLDVDQTKTARLPEVEVNGGQAPAFDVDTGEVVVGTKKEVVEVPVVGVQKAENDSKE